MDLTGTVITADALRTHPEAAEFLVTRKQAHYLFGFPHAAQVLQVTRKTRDLEPATGASRP